MYSSKKLFHVSIKSEHDQSLKILAAVETSYNGIIIAEPNMQFTVVVRSKEMNITYGLKMFIDA
jgi:hypothetical protein